MGRPTTAIGIDDEQIGRLRCFALGGVERKGFQKSGQSIMSLPGIRILDHAFPLFSDRKLFILS
jgi:hypothetical protein